MRVIAGEARGRSLEALPGTDVTRPTLSQVKEAMFSIVQFDLPGARVLDLYAGSGQLGIEALSRGAARCVFLDENREAVSIVMRNCKACGVFDRSRVNIGEAARYLSACREQFDIVLLDPPFRNGTLEKILPTLRGQPVMLDFSADWCVSCLEFERETLADPAVRAKLREFALLRADVTDNTPAQRELMQRYRVFGPPTLLFFDREGRLRKNRVTGFVDAAEFLAILEGLGSNLSQE